MQARVCPSHCLYGGLALLLLATVFLLTTLWMAMPGVAKAPVPRLCTSADCADHAAALGVGKYDVLGRSTEDPCLDFGQFVCSVAEIRYPWSGFPLMTQMLIDYVIQFGRQLPTVAVLAKAGLAMRTCLDTSTRSDEGRGTPSRVHGGPQFRLASRRKGPR
ncbi:hypothetical protein MTO96_034709 [Rhipicephalus appendiculatus]